MHHYHAACGSELARVRAVRASWEGPEPPNRQGYPPLSSVFLNFLNFSELGVSSSEAENCIYSWLLPRHDLSWMKT